MQSNILDLQKSFQKITFEYLRDLLKEKIDSINIAEQAIKLKKKICEPIKLPNIQRLRPYYDYLSQAIQSKSFDIDHTVSYIFLKIISETNLITSSQYKVLLNIITKKKEIKYIADTILKKPLKFISNPDLNQYLEEKADREISLCRANKIQFEIFFGEVKSIFNKIDWTSMGINNPKLIAFGASVNGFQIQNSDLDITILTNSFINERQLLKLIYEHYLKSTDSIKYKIELKASIKIRVPIITIQLFEHNNFKVDLSINNILGLINSNLLFTYSKVDFRIEQLGILLKLWKKAKNITKMTSYALMLIMINYLQRLDYPLTPSLQKISKVPKEIKIKRILHDGVVYDKNVRVDFETNIDEIKKHISESQKNYNLITLLKGFFEFCTIQNKNVNTILSIKHSTVLPRVDAENSLLNADTSKDKFYLFSLEDPFDDTYDPGRLKDDQAKKVLEEMKKALDLLNSCSNKSDIERLFQ